jgi:hypothetical protein
MLNKSDQSDDHDLVKAPLSTTILQKTLNGSIRHSSATGGITADKKLTHKVPVIISSYNFVGSPVESIKSGESTAEIVSKGGTIPD